MNKKNSKFIGTAELEAVYSELDDNIKQDYIIAKKAKKQIEELEQKEPASLEKKEVYDILENVKKNINEYTLKYYSNYSFNRYYQKNKEIYEYATNENADDKFVGSISFDELIINYDPLELFETTYIVKYYNHIRKKLILIENVTKKKLIKELENTNCFLDKKQIEPVLNHLIIFLNKKGDLKVTENINKKGFYILKDKVIENSDIKNLDYDERKLKKAFNLLNEILNQRGEKANHDAAVYRFMLHSPFHWCIKQLGKANHNIKYYELYGKRGANKTGAVKIGQWFYSENPIFEEDTANTVPAFARKIQENTFPSLFDESANLLKQDGMDQTLKSSTPGKFSRSVSDMDSTEDNKSYLALSTPIFTHNEPHIITDGNIRRSMPLHYDESYKISDDIATKFIVEYNPENTDSKLKILNYLGYAFKSKIIPLIEANDNKLIDIENLAIELLKEIADEVGVKLNPYLLKEAERSSGLDEDPIEKLKKGLRKLTKNIRLGYNEDSFCSTHLNKCANTGTFSWLYKQKTRDGFIIHQKNFKEECEQITGTVLTIQEILVNLDLINKGDKVEFKLIKVNRINVYGFRICANDLAHKIFGISLDDEKELDNFLINGDDDII